MANTASTKHGYPTVDTTPPKHGSRCRAETPEKVELNPRKSRHMTIALTGGPCSGKSSILALIRDRLSKRGIQVVTVPEYATHFFANSDGFQVEWVGTEKEENLQDILLRYQLAQEDMFQDFASLNTKQAVLLLDRSVMDQKVFTSSDKIWQSALIRNNVTEEELLSRYDLIMHLGTCAKVGDYEWGPGSNNPGRYHSPEEASRLDNTCEDVYRGHKQFRKVPHCGKFEDKVEQVMKYLEDALGVDGLAGRRQRVGVQVSSFPPEVLAESQASVITSTYLDQDMSMQLSVRRRRKVPVAQWSDGLKGAKVPEDSCPLSQSHWDQTFEQRYSIPDDCFLARRVLQEAEYYSEVKLAQSPGIDKYVLTFQVGAGLHYELFYFQGSDGALVLDFPVGAELPAWLAQAEPEVRSHPTEKSEAPRQVLAGSDRKSRVLRKNSTEEAAEEYFRTRSR